MPAPRPFAADPAECSRPLLSSIHHSYHRTGRRGARDQLGSGQADELRRHPLDHVHRPTQLLHCLIQPDSEIDLGPLLQRRWPGSRLRLWLNPSGWQRGGSGVGSLPLSFPIQLGQRRGGGAPGGQSIASLDEARTVRPLGESTQRADPQRSIGKLSAGSFSQCHGSPLQPNPRRRNPPGRPEVLDVVYSQPWPGLDGAWAWPLVLAAAGCGSVCSPE